MSETEIVAVNNKVTGAVAAPQTISIFDCSQSDLLKRITEVSNALKDIIVQQKLEVNIGGGKHLKVEGWNTMGMMLGIMPQVSETNWNADEGFYEAHVELINISTGRKVGKGIAMCGDVSDGNWSKKSRNQKLSMAITRATGKAYRMGMSFIITMAGYSPTPAEEMEHFNIFDMGNQDDLNRLAEFLAKEKIDQKYWPRIEMIMHGRESTVGNIKDCINLLKDKD